MNAAELSGSRHQGASRAADDGNPPAYRAGAPAMPAVEPLDDNRVS